MLLGEEIELIRAGGKNFSYLYELAQKEELSLCIYGCGANGEIICDYLKRIGTEIEFFVDRQAECGEFEVLGKRVISPVAYFEMFKENKIIISLDNYGTIFEYLIKHGIKEENIIIPFKVVEREIYLPSIDYNLKLQENFIRKYEKKKDEPSATIFTILYNTPSGMLCRAVKSVLNQNYGNFKYLVIDNGSTDDSSKIIKRYAEVDERVVYVRLEKNVVWTDKEILFVLEKYIDTEYVAMLDSDDYYESDFLQKAVNIARTQSADMVQVNTLTYAHEGFKYSYFTHYLGQDKCVEGKEKERLFMQRIIFVPVWGKLFSVKVFKKLIELMLSYDSDQERDRNFCLDISWITYMVFLCERIALCDDILHIRTWRQGSSEHSDDHSSKWLSSILWSFDYLRSVGISYQDSQVFEEAQLMWLFSLQRENIEMVNFREKELKNKRVKEFMNRPVCYKYRGYYEKK